MPFAETLTPFLADFGTDGVLAGQPVRGIFDAPGGQAFGGSAGASTAELTYQLPTASVPAAPRGATLLLPGRTYTVQEHLPDGTGMSVLVLQRA